MHILSIIGLGPLGLIVLDRLCSVLEKESANPAQIVVYLFDDSQGGFGTHNPALSQDFLMNTPCGQVSLLPATSLTGAIGTPAMSLFEWATAHRKELGNSVRPTWEQFMGPLSPDQFLSRSTLGRYLASIAKVLIARASSLATVVQVKHLVERLTSLPDGGVTIHFGNGQSIFSNTAFLTVGHARGVDLPRNVDILRDPHYQGVVLTSSASDLACIGTGEHIGLLGMGLTALDAIVSLTTGRGGSFEGESEQLIYRPSGREPRILLFSESGLPFAARPSVASCVDYRYQINRTEWDNAALPASVGTGTTASDPLVANVSLPLARLVQNEYRAAERYGVRQAMLLRERIAIPRTRVDPPLPQPLRRIMTVEGLPKQLTEFANNADYESTLVGFVQDDLREAKKGRLGSQYKHSLELYRDLRGNIRSAVDHGALTTEAHERFYVEFVPFLNRIVGGPTISQVSQLLALHSAGIVQFPFGPSPRISRESATTPIVISSTRFSQPSSRTVHRVVLGTLHASPTPADRLVANMLRAGAFHVSSRNLYGALGVDVDRDSHPLDSAGKPQPDIFEIGRAHV